MDVTFFILLIVAIALGVRIGRDPGIVADWLGKMILNSPALFRYLVFFAIVGGSFVLSVYIMLTLATEYFTKFADSVLISLIIIGFSILIAGGLAVHVGFLLYYVNKHGFVKGIKKTFEDAGKK